jgi:hypothetical protein
MDEINRMKEALAHCSEYVDNLSEVQFNTVLLEMLDRRLSDDPKAKDFVNLFREVVSYRALKTSINSITKGDF